MPSNKKPTKKTPKKRTPDAAPVTPRIARRERRRERSREEIVEAARRVLIRDGLGAASLAAVAKEVGLTKAALYYYYPSKDALFFEIIIDTVASQARAVSEAVERTKDGGEALGAIVRAIVETFAPRLDDFRLAYLQAQVAGPGAATITDEQLARIRPLNDLAFGAAAKMLTSDWKQRRGRAQVEPRMLAFLASLAAMGVLTMKGMVESAGDPLLYSDEQLIDGFARVFAAAAAP